MKILSEDGQICLFGNKTYELGMCFHQNPQSTKRQHIYMSRLNELCGIYINMVMSYKSSWGMVLSYFFLQNLFEMIKTRVPKMVAWKRYMVVLQR